MEKKVTKRDYYAMLTALVEKSTADNKTELLGFIDHEVELLTKKSSKTSMTATQKANLEILDVIRNVMRELGEPSTIGVINKQEPLKDYSSQKVSALVKKLVDSGDVERTEVKKTAYFTLTEQGKSKCHTDN